MTATLTAGKAPKSCFANYGVVSRNLPFPRSAASLRPALFATSRTARSPTNFSMAAILRLAWLRTENGLERVNWRDMETEELGSVYESLLELTPSLTGPQGFQFVDAAGHERKTTASYYTPDSLVQALLDETLDATDC